MAALVRSAGLLLALACVSAIASCGRSEVREVVLYTSADDYIVREVVDAFQNETGIRVRLQGDTEAAKTTGLVLRLLAEKQSPRADVWWSSEPFGTIQLSREGVLSPYTSTAAEADMGGAWPSALRPADGTWYGFASRARVIAYNTNTVAREEAPRTLRDLTEPRWSGRVGMAKPQFGTTRGHMAALVALYGEDALRDWLIAMKANGLRLYDGNASAVQAVARGEIHLCLTDTDDVWAGQRNNWPVELVYEVADQDAPEHDLPSFGAMVIPNTVARVRGGPNHDNAAVLIDFLLSERVERILAESDSGNAPVRPRVAADYPRSAFPLSDQVDLFAIEAAVPRAIAVCEDVLSR